MKRKLSCFVSQKFHKLNINSLTCALACSPTRMTSLVASCNGMSDMNNPLPVRPSRPSMKGDPTNNIEFDSEQ